MDRILVANRGEIACRIIRSVQQLGKHAIAVYSEADADAPHRHLADEARCIGPPPAPQSYLNAEAILHAAADSHADGLHPGYGFLAENADFAVRCLDLGLTFVGPSPDAMRQMGDKARARHIAQEAGVPVIPGSASDALDPARAHDIAEAIGYPVLLKAAGGGGGIGMQVVAEPSGLDKAFASAQNRAKSAFGNPVLYLEKFLSAPRHIEVQILGDTHGNLVHLYERECSIQRRHQKIIEEAPAVLLAQPEHAALRQRMTRAALAIAQAVQYTNAGTVEFLVDDTQGFYFIEMNTRLQVEHTVTEMVTGVDLVAEQIRLAEGASLPWRQEDLTVQGAAVECRICAEDPAKNFLPAPGQITTIDFPTGAGLRIDSGIQAGTQVTPYYDSLLAKVITHGPTRHDAIDRMQHALATLTLDGLITNIALHQQLMQHPRFHAGDIDTTFLARVLTERDSLLT
jgi:acetyl-CoA carboxylase biotin carboxylase subunit